MMESLYKRALCEALGTGMLVMAVVGSGIMAERLAGGNLAIALLANTLATGAALLVLILTFGPLSGAHLNPAVTIAMAARRMMSWQHVPAYVAAQFAGGTLGTLLTHVMFAVPIFSFSNHRRAGWPQLVGEFVATFGLLFVIWGCLRAKSLLVIPVAVACYITSAYWFTSSTSFANPAVTVARCLTDSFAGIRPADVPGFIAAQALGALAATALSVWLLPHDARVEAASESARLKPDTTLFDSL
jgi:glycerol uptake facilitator-like aquaporin